MVGHNYVRELFHLQIKIYMYTFTHIFCIILFLNWPQVPLNECIEVQSKSGFPLKILVKDECVKITNIVCFTSSHGFCF